MYIPANELSMNMHMHLIIYIFISQYACCILAPHISQQSNLHARTHKEGSFGAAKSNPAIGLVDLPSSCPCLCPCPRSGPNSPSRTQRGKPPQFYTKLVAMIRDEIFEGPCDLSNMQRKYVFSKGIFGGPVTKIPRFVRNCHALSCRNLS